MCAAPRQPKWFSHWTSPPGADYDARRAVDSSRDATLRLRRLRRLRRMLVREQISVERYVQERDALLGHEPGERED